MTPDSDTIDVVSRAVQQALDGAASGNVDAVASSFDVLRGHGLYAVVAALHYWGKVAVRGPAATHEQAGDYVYTAIGVDDDGAVILDIDQASDPASCAATRLLAAAANDDQDSIVDEAVAANDAGVLSDAGAMVLRLAAERWRVMLS